VKVSDISIAHSRLNFITDRPSPWLVRCSSTHALPIRNMQWAGRQTI